MAQPTSGLGCGGICFLLVREDEKEASSRFARTLRDIDADLVTSIRQLPSFLHMELFVRPGSDVLPTIDCFTFGGLVVLAHKEFEQFTLDFDFVSKVDKSGSFFVF